MPELGCLFRLAVPSSSSPLPLFDQFFDFLTTLVADPLVKCRAVAAACCLAPDLAADFADGFVEVVTVGRLRGLSALLSDFLVELSAVLFLYGLAAFLPGF